MFSMIAVQEAEQMNNTGAFGAYDKTAKTVESGKVTDAVVLEKAAFMLENLQRNVDSEDWEATLNHNRLIWTVIQSAMIDNGQHLPDDVKANLLSLSIYVDKRTMECLHNPERKASDLDVLIDMNRNIALGLRGNPGI